LSRVNSAWHFAAAAENGWFIDDINGVYLQLVCAERIFSSRTRLWLEYDHQLGVLLITGLPRDAVHNLGSGYGVPSSVHWKFKWMQLLCQLS
jgi:hypothetical protein